jgi:hypothetical protein
VASSAKSLGQYLGPNQDQRFLVSIRKRLPAIAKAMRTFIFG